MVLRFEGEHEFQMGGRHYCVVRAGSIFATRLLPHTRLKVSNSPRKMLGITQPAGGLEDFLVEFAAFLRGPADPGIRATIEKYSMKVIKGSTE